MRSRTFELTRCCKSKAQHGRAEGDERVLGAHGLIPVLMCKEARDYEADEVSSGSGNLGELVELLVDGSTLYIFSRVESQPSYHTFAFAFERGCTGIALLRSDVVFIW